MIRTANESDFDRKISSESELRICALKRAYGLNVPFIRFFADDEGSLASVMDGFCNVYVHKKLNEEWQTFLQMHADIRTIHADENTIAILATARRIPFKKGVVMRFDNMLSKCALHANEQNACSLYALYVFLSTVFDDFPLFDGWYVDVSHRVRHGCCHIATESENERLIGCAMTVAETDTAALIGGVSTSPEHRGRGVASRCISELLTRLPQKNVFIAPSDEPAAGLYRKLGFVPCGTWAELTLPYSGG